MTDFFSENRIADPKAAEDGVWVLGAWHGKLDIKVRRAQSARAQEVLRNLRAAYTVLRSGKLPEDQQDELNRRWAAEGILIDWRAAKGATGEPPAYSPKVAFDVLSREPDLYADVIYFSTEAETFRTQKIEEAAGNSEKSSAGKSKPEPMPQS